MAIERRKGKNSIRVIYPHPVTGWNPPARWTATGETWEEKEQAALRFEALWRFRQSQNKLGDLHAELHPEKVAAEEQPDLVLFGDFLIDDAFPHWKRTPGRGRSGQKAKKSTDMIRDYIMDHVFEAEYERNEHGHAKRDKDGLRIVVAWGSDSLANVPLHGIDAKIATEFAQRLEEKRVGHPPAPLGAAVRTKVLSFCQQSWDYAVVVYPELYGRPNPFSFVKKPSGSVPQTVRAFKPDVVEVMRCDFRLIETLSELCLRGLITRKQRKALRELGWPIPENPYLARFTTAFISAFAYSSARPQELLAVPQTAAEEKRLNVDRHNVNGEIKPGTKSTRYPRKRPLLIGPGAADLAAWREWLNGALPVRPMLLFPSADGRPWSETDYRNWRKRYYGPVARRNGLSDDPQPDDDADGGAAPGSPRPYALRHVYATLRLAAHHETLAVERSMGTSLVRSVYADVIEDYEAQGPLDIDAEVARARVAAPAVTAANFRRDALNAGIDLASIEAILAMVFPLAA